MGDMTDIEKIQDIILRLDGRDPEAVARCRAIYGASYPRPEVMLAQAVLDTLAAMGVGAAKLPIISRDEIARQFPLWKGGPLPHKPSGSR